MASYAAKIVTCVFAFLSLASLSGADASRLHAAAAQSGGRSARCYYLTMKLGPAVELNGNDQVFVDEARERLNIESDGVTFAYDLNKGGLAELKERNRFPHYANRQQTRMGSARNEAGTVDDAIPAVRRLPLAEGTYRLPNGRNLSISRLYVNNYIAKVGTEDAEA